MCARSRVAPATDGSRGGRRWDRARLSFDVAARKISPRDLVDAGQGTIRGKNTSPESELETGTRSGLRFGSLGRGRTRISDARSTNASRATSCLNALQKSLPAVSKLAGSLGASATDLAHAAAIADATSRDTPAASPRSAAILQRSSSGNSLSTGHDSRWAASAAIDDAPGGSPPLHAAATSPAAPSSAPNSESFRRIPSYLAVSNATGVRIGRYLNVDPFTGAAVVADGAEGT